MLVHLILWKFPPIKVSAPAGVLSVIEGGRTALIVKTAGLIARTVASAEFVTFTLQFEESVFGIVQL